MNPQQMELIKSQEQLRALIEQKQKIDSQVNEILMAKEEVDLLEDDATIYKLVGPLMVPQDPKEVRETIKSRLKYLNEKIEYVEKEIKAKHPK
jgi:prefoldin beta subunit